MVRFSLAQLLVILLVCANSAAAKPQVNYVNAFPNLSFSQPVLITHAGDGSDRLFVVEQSGTIQVFANKASASESFEFFDIRKATGNRFLDGGEQGLLGLAFDPEFKRNGYFYVNYTASKPRRTVVARYRVDAESETETDYESETILIEVNQDYANHNGGMLAFGKEGHLYIGMGDGGSGGDPKNRAQDGRSLLGKMLRISTDGSIPKDNPFIENDNVRDEIWAIGLRNPWRFSFDRQTGALWAGDVGQSEREEVDIIVRGWNYGWRLFEGSERYRAESGRNQSDFEFPVFEYDHSEGRSITGGVVYRGQQFPAMDGWYFFGDFVSGAMWALSSETKMAVELASLPNPAAFGEDEAGEVFVVSYQGKIYRIVDRTDQGG